MPFARHAALSHSNYLIKRLIHAGAERKGKPNTVDKACKCGWWRLASSKRRTPACSQVLLAAIVRDKAKHNGNYNKCLRANPIFSILNC